MNLRKISLYLLCLAVGLVSCKKDDDEEIIVIEIEDRDEQQEKDMVLLDAYLASHYYNATEIEAAKPNASILDINIIKVEQGGVVPVGYTKLSDAVEKKSVDFADTDYEYYLLNLNEGGGADSPTFSDKIRFNYEGFKLDDTVFDYSVFPADSDLIGNGTTTFGLIPGWRKVMPFFKTAESFVENGDGTIDYMNSGLGVMFLPSGLAYFSTPSASIPAYSPIIFKFELLQTFENDHDGDGIPSYLEDLNSDGEFTVNFENLTDATDDDTDGDGAPNYIETDDDGDGIPTKDEIIISTINKPTREEITSTPLESNQVLLNKINKQPNGTFTGTIITFKDTVVGGAFDYLDKDN